MDKFLPVQKYNIFVQKILMFMLLCLARVKKLELKK